MAGKKILGLACAALLISAAAISFILKEEPLVETPKPEQNQVKKPAKPVQSVQPVVKEEAVKKDLYSATPYDLPLISVAEISKLSPDMKKSVDEIIEEAQGIYYLKYDKDSETVLVILQNPIFERETYNRHGLQFAEIDKDGNKKYYTEGYNGEDGEIASAVEDTKDDLWEFDRTIEPVRPIKHVKYNDKGKVQYTEVWNYSSDEPVKYQMKNARKKIVSIMKETLDNESNYRKEHIFYDDEGNTLVSVSINYDGANITRFTYYNSNESLDNITIITEYAEGFKTKERVYNEDYELLYIVQADYNNDERVSIKIFDNKNLEIDSIN